MYRISIWFLHSFTYSYYAFVSLHPLVPLVSFVSFGLTWRLLMKPVVCNVPAVCYSYNYNTNQAPGKSFAALVRVLTPLISLKCFVHSIVYNLAATLSGAPMAITITIIIRRDNRHIYCVLNVGSKQLCDNQTARYLQWWLQIRCEIEITHIFQYSQSWQNY